LKKQPPLFPRMRTRELLGGFGSKPPPEPEPASNVYGVELTTAPHLLYVTASELLPCTDGSLLVVERSEDGGPNTLAGFGPGQWLRVWQVDPICDECRARGERERT